MDLRAILTIVLVLAVLPTQAQFWKKKKRKAQEIAPVEQPTSLSPSASRSAERVYAPKARRKAAKGPTYGLEEEFYERMERVAKERKKAEKLMEKPQYSDPMYFGHKRKPKKRPPHKMKFCKECGIRH